MCIIEKGCCGLNLRRCCLIIGIVYIVLNILFLVAGFFAFSLFMRVTHAIFSAINILASIFLIVAAVKEKKYFIIPWFIGYAATVLQFIIAVIVFSLMVPGYCYKMAWQMQNNNGPIDHTTSNPNEKEGGFEKTREVSVFMSFVECGLQLAIESAVLSYVISYYVELKPDSDPKTEIKRTD